MWPRWLLLHSSYLLICSVVVMLLERKKKYQIDIESPGSENGLLEFEKHIHPLRSVFLYLLLFTPNLVHT